MVGADAHMQNGWCGKTALENGRHLGRDVWYRLSGATFLVSNQTSVGARLFFSSIVANVIGRVDAVHRLHRSGGWACGLH